jgi:S1-C subfamily serine protease
MVRLGIVLGATLAALSACAPQQGGSRTTYRIDGVQYRSPEEFLAAVRRVEDEKVAAVSPVSDRIGGSAKIIIPDRNRLRPLVQQSIKGPTPANLVDLAIDTRQSDLRSRIDALKKSAIFDSLEVAETNATESPDLDGADYLVWYQVRATGPNNTGAWVGGWRVRKAGSARQEAANGDPGVAANEMFVAWVKSVREAAGRLGATSVAVSGQPAAKAGGAGKSGSLTGIAISPEGHILTAYHGVDECREVKVAQADGELDTASVVARDKQNDLAVLKLPRRVRQVATLRDTAVRSGENVLAIGYPLANMLSSNATVTTGSISALSGMGDDSRLVQFSAPVQPGNSGGPLLDAGGNVAALVQSKLNALRVAMVTGDIPQNVNFGVKTSVLRIFLDANGIPYRTGPFTREMHPPEVAEAARRFTVLVECWR